MNNYILRPVTKTDKELSTNYILTNKASIEYLKDIDTTTTNVKDAFVFESYNIVENMSDYLKNNGGDTYYIRVLEQSDKKIDTPKLIPMRAMYTWGEWLTETEKGLKYLGYSRFEQEYKDEDFTYWKVFYSGDERIYQIGISFYDFRKHTNKLSLPNRIGVEYECMILNLDTRVCLTMGSSLTLPDFETMSMEFYDLMKPKFENSTDEN